MTVSLQANIMIKICDEKKSKTVGLVKINLGTFIEQQEADPSGVMSAKVMKMSLEKCPDKSAVVEFSLKTTLVNANLTG